MTLPTRRVLTRAEALPDAVPNTDAAAVARARSILADPYLLRRDGTGWLVTGLQVAEQALIAARTQALLRLGDHMLQGHDPQADIIRLMALAAAPQIVAAIRTPLVVAWTTRVRDRYDDAFVTTHFDRPNTWVLNKNTIDAATQATVASERAARTTVYAGNLRWHADNQVAATVQLQAVALGAAANLLVLGSTLGASMGLAQGVALILALAYGKRAFGSISAQSQTQVAANNALGAHMRRFWDNVTLGNSNSSARWHKVYEDKAAHADSLTDATSRQNALRDSTMMALVAGPMLLALAVGLVQAQQQPSAEVMRHTIQNLVIQGPTLIGATRTIVSLSEVTWNTFAKRHNELARTLIKAQEPKSIELMAHCRPEEITVSHGTRKMLLSDAMGHLLEAAQLGAPGHYTLSGANGSGKSMALLQLKKLLGPRVSMIVPAELRDLDFGSTPLSTGEADREAVRQALASKAHVLLLDEVTAHLHPDKMREMRGAIAQAAAPKSAGGGGHLVIEISHRTAEA